MKTQNHEVEIYVFRLQFFFWGGGRTPKLDSEIFMLLRGHITGKSLVGFSLQLPT